MRSDEFLRLYRIVEELLDKKYAAAERHHSSVVMEYISDPESRPVRDDLDLCREIRNILSHNADMDGGAVVDPSEAMLRRLSEILAYVQSPPMARSYATSVDAILKADPDWRVLRLMRTMRTRGFSHVPVVENRRVTGVFSVGTVFTHAMESPDSPLTERTCLTALSRLLPVDAHIAERYVFMHTDASYYDVKEAFEEKTQRNSRLAAIFLTDTGEPNGILEGMITPWDVLGRPQP